MTPDEREYQMRLKREQELETKMLSVLTKTLATIRRECPTAYAEIVRFVNAETVQ